jgi:REP element-mobilizing transposase RayT
MTIPTASGHRYFRKLPHFRIPGGIYHVRLSTHPGFGMLVNDEDFQIIQDAIMFMHKRKCILIAFVIMPNHAHLLIQPLPMIDKLSAWCDYTEQYRLEQILGGIKSYSSRRINRRHGRTGKPFWMSECFDRIARNDKDVDGIADYIHGNPVRWGLALRPEDYRWSSASTIYSGNEEYRDWFV